jgi:hypothetical protein
VQRDRLAESDGRTATGSNHAVGAKPTRLLARRMRNFDGYVHARAVEDSGAAFTEATSDVSRQRLLLRRRQYQRAFRAELFDLFRQLVERMWSEHHAARQRFENEGIHLGSP